MCYSILNWRDISPNYVSRASSSFVASGPSVIHSLTMHYLRLCMRSSPRGSTFATAFCMVSVLTSSIVFNPFSTLRQGLFWKSRSRSYLRRYAKRVALAPYCATYQLQDLPSRAQLSGGYWSNVPIRILHPGELRGRKTSSSFCCLIRSGGASIPPWTLWSSRFLSCGAASVEFTSSRYSELRNWTGHFQEETKNFFNAAVADNNNNNNEFNARFVFIWRHRGRFWGFNAPEALYK